ncbi:MAG: beta-glucosidase [Myxococcales bacterium]|nr:beta-glucosidase [Myxococcales bacterium]
MTALAFPPGFVWGAATSAFQIEGATTADGRGESIWDRFAATPGRIEDGRDGADACDHYHHWPEDVALMQRLGLGAYRFSIAWPRVVPAGRGPTNPAGLDFYDRLVDGLLAAGIAPCATLYHWDLPQALEDAGGWGARATVDAFADYADVVTRRLGDRVRRWMTINEPWCVAVLGHEQGAHAPGHRDPALGLRAAHHALLAHGRAVPIVRASVPGAEVGIVVNLVPATPATTAAADHDAARWFDGFFNRWFLDPLYGRGYPADAIADRVARGHLARADLPFVVDGDLAVIAARTDFLGVNYYNPTVVRADPADGHRVIEVATGAPRTDMGWEVVPGGLHTLLMRIHRDYRPARIYVTENGAAYDDPIDAGGHIADARRVAYLRGHLIATARALADGAPVAGYFHWSLLDNFEWSYGYTKRFGLVHVDFTTQRRTPRASAHVYRSIVAANAVEPEPSP